jgi:hypothetical protein
MKLAGNSLSFMEEMRNAYKISVGKTEGKAWTCEDNIKIDLNLYWPCST